MMSVLGMAPSPTLAPHDIPLKSTVLVTFAGGCFWAEVKAHQHATTGDAVYLVTAGGQDSLCHRADILWNPRMISAAGHAFQHDVGRA